MTDKTRFTFHADEFVGSQLQREIYNAVYLDDGAKWTEVLRAFTDFMASVYGYSIDDKIIIKSGDDETVLRDYY